MDEIVKNILLNNLTDSSLTDKGNYLLKVIKVLKKKEKRRKIIAILKKRLYSRRIAKCKQFFKTISEYDDDVFYEHFGMNKNTFKSFVKMLKGKWSFTKTGRPPYSLEKCVYITLWKLANQNTFREISDKFAIGMGTAYKIFRNTVIAISKLKNEIIKFPSTEPALRKIVEDFEQARANPFPSVIGCIDGSHVQISAPTTDASSYYNRKGYYSVILQGVVDSKYRFIDAFVGYPGRCHDASVWRDSPLKKALMNHTIRVPADYHLLGDSAYPLETNLMVPYRDNGFLTSEQRNFNSVLSSTRVFVEQAFGILKSKFRILHHIDVQSLPLAKKIIMSCIVIYNIILKFEAPDVTDMNLNRNLNNETVDENIDVSNSHQVNIEAKSKRELLTTLISA